MMQSSPGLPVPSKMPDLLGDKGHERMEQIHQFGVEINRPLIGGPSMANHGDRFDQLELQKSSR